MVQRKKKVMTHQERVILCRERGIQRMKDKIARIQARADADIVVVKKRIQRAQVLLDAIKAGTLSL